MTFDKLFYLFKYGEKVELVFILLISGAFIILLFILLLLLLIFELNLIALLLLILFLPRKLIRLNGNFGGSCTFLLILIKSMSSPG